MLERWALAYADRWGLPGPALDELREMVAAVARGEVAPEPGPMDTEPGSDPDEDSEDPPARPLPVQRGQSGERYEDIGYIGMGGMGEVRRVWDCTLNRPLAMKILRKELLARVDLIARFKEEAEATAQLEHPCIVPIHDMGTLQDNRVFFTMKEIRGRTLLDVIDEVHTASVDNWDVGPSGWSLVKLVQAFGQVCECIAYAHSRGVLHRDLKPSNVMVGAFGEVAVMDWGLAKIKGLGDGFGDSIALGTGSGPVVTERSREGWVTRVGSIAGTPNYMPPEQATGEHARVGPWSDVYALGAILYHILSDRPPYDGHDVDGVVRQVLAAPPPPARAPWRARAAPGAGVEDGLIAICDKAMARDLADRYMDAGALGEAVQAWLEGARVREQALALVARADALEPDILDLRRQVASLRAQAEHQLRAIPTTAPADEKRAAWGLQDQAADLEGQLADLRARYGHLLHAALAWLPDLPEARDRLAALESDKARGGAGYVTVRTDPAGLDAVAHPIHVVGRRRVEGEGVPLGRTPLDRVPLPAGDWVIRAGSLVMPVRITAGEHWSGARPGETIPVVHPAADPGHDAIHVAAGWVVCGGDIEREDALVRQKVWVDGFAIGRHPVTAGQYRAFLDHLDATGDGVRAAILAPNLDGAPLWHRGADRWELPDGWRDDHPARAVSWEGAVAFAKWRSSVDGVAWRLPTEIEWEKAARGCDERLFPWGDYADPTWCCIATSHGGSPAPSPVGAFPADVSPYGVRGLGGNVRDWCTATNAPEGIDPTQVPINDRIVRGGHWLGIAQFARSALRYRLPTSTHPGVGFRLVRTVRT